MIERSFLAVYVHDTKQSQDDTLCTSSDQGDKISAKYFGLLSTMTSSFSAEEP